MNRKMKKVLFFSLLLALLPSKSWAWQDNKAAHKAVNALFRNLESVQLQFAEFTPKASFHPDLFMPVDIDKDGVWEIWVRSHDNLVGVLYAQDKNGGLYTIAADDKNDDIVINGNLVKVTTTKHAGVSQSMLVVMSGGVSEQAPFFEQSTYNGKTETKYVDDAGKPVGSAATKKFLAKVVSGKEISKKKFFEIEQYAQLCQMSYYLDLPNDITFREHVIFGAPEEYAENNFLGLSDPNVKDAKAYTKMVFKPHITDVKFVKMAKDNDFSFRMTDPSFVKKCSAAISHSKPHPSS